jgi:hypothetical protein
MIDLPPWVLVAALVLGMLGSIAGITGAVLGIRNERQRRREARPDVTVSWEERQYDEDTRRAWIEVRNKGSVAIEIVDLFFKMADPSEGESISRSGLLGYGREFPFRLEPRAWKIFNVTLPFLFPQKKAGIYDVVATVEDGLGNPYESAPFVADLRDPSPPSEST